MLRITTNAPNVEGIGVMTTALLISMAAFALAASISPGLSISSRCRLACDMDLSARCGSAQGATTGIHRPAGSCRPWIERRHSWLPNFLAVVRWGGVLFLVYMAVGLATDGGAISAGADGDCAERLGWSVAPMAQSKGLACIDRRNGRLLGRRRCWPASDLRDRLLHRLLSLRRMLGDRWNGSPTVGGRSLENQSDEQTACSTAGSQVPPIWRSPASSSRSRAAYRPGLTAVKRLKSALKMSLIVEHRLA